MSASRDVAAFGALVLVVLLSRAALADEPAPTLQSMYDEAQKLSEDPARRDEAIKKLEAIVAAHRANAEVADASLVELDRQFQAAGREADAMRYFAGLAIQEYSGGRQNHLGKILAAYQVKDPEQFRKVLVELGATPRKAVVAAPTNKDLAAQIIQREDRALRDAMLLKLRDQLAAKQPHEVKRGALQVLSQALTAKFDREPFRELLLPLLKSPDWQVRMLTLGCLPGVTTNVDDVKAVAPLADDPSPDVRGVVASTLIGIGDGKLSEVVVPAFLKLLADMDADVVRHAVTSQWGQYPHPELDAKLIALADNPLLHHEAIYFGLSTQKAKSADVCKRLVAELADPDWNNSGRAAWGLTYGVAEDAHALVEEGLLKALPEETNAYTRGEELKALENVASEKSRPYLAKVAANDAETDADREAAKRILAKLDAAGK